MSTGTLKRSCLVALIILFGLLSGYGIMLTQKSHTVRRQIAASSESALQNLPGLGKHLAPVRVQILVPANIPDRDDQEVEITGYVTVNQITPGELQYEWILPEGVQLVDGITADVWTGLHPGQTAITKISVRGFSKELKRNLTLEAFVQAGTTRMGNTAVISSRPEDSMESIAPQKMKSKEDFDAEKANSF